MKRYEVTLMRHGQVHRYIHADDLRAAQEKAFRIWGHVVWVREMRAA